MVITPRLAPRATVSAEAVLCVDEKDFACVLIDISAHGGRIRLDKEFPSGKLVALRLPPFGSLRARTVWNRTGMIGLKFEDDAMEINAILMGLATYGAV